MPSAIDVGGDVRIDRGNRIQILLHGGLAFRRRIDRAADQSRGLAAGRKGPQAGHEILQLHDRSAVADAHDAVGDDR